MHVISASVTNGVDGNLQDPHRESHPNLASGHCHCVLAQRMIADEHRYIKEDPFFPLPGLSIPPYNCVLYHHPSWLSVAYQHID